MDAHPGFADVPIERVREFWDRAPCNVRHSNKTVGTREYFDEVEQRKYFVEPHIPGFASFQTWAGRRGPESGCGLGTDTVDLARAGAQGNPGEVAEDAAALARQRLPV